IKRVAGTGPADPVLRSPELAEQLVATAAVVNEDPVDLAQQPQGERKSRPHPLDPVLDGGEVVAHLDDVAQGYAGCGVDLRLVSGRTADNPSRRPSARFARSMRSRSPGVRSIGG